MGTSTYRDTGMTTTLTFTADLEDHLEVLECRADNDELPNPLVSTTYIALYCRSYKVGGTLKLVPSSDKSGQNLCCDVSHLFDINTPQSVCMQLAIEVNTHQKHRVPISMIMKCLLEGGNTGIQPIVKSNFALDFIQYILVENSSPSRISSTMELRDVEFEAEMAANDGNEKEDDDVMETEVVAEVEVEEDAIFKTEAEVKAGTDVGAGSDVKLRIRLNAGTAVKKGVEFKTEAEVKAGTDVRTGTDVKEEVGCNVELMPKKKLEMLIWSKMF
ncbi:unnamed protein product [Mytilus coruscus]|uniref:Uncharacterized protein n=1 Tax=Mytilus coruscus TaxID=42192 RepID=A0A6J8A600_MYTCO|nr:unnamed protein product [Mytilus coruscus]